MLSPDVIAQAEKRIGQTIGGKWHLDRVIGVGGMAAVYEATHRNRNRVAIKLLHPILSLDEGTRHRFLREGYVANTIRHEGAVQVLDDDLTEEGVAFLVMELLLGETVENRMDRKGGALEIGEALELIEQLLDVLCAAHDQGVVHRDIKPDNLFLTEDGRLKVLDFGIARLHQGSSRSTRVGSFMGTPAYCAPEQARGRWDEVDARTDLFSVAATLFTIITGDHVHPAETSSEQLALAIGSTARSLSEALPKAPRELVEFVDTALSYDKEDRFQSARAMKAALRRVRAGLSDVRLGAPSPVERSGKPFATLHTATIAEDSDSFEPPALYPVRLPVRILMGVLALAVLATFALILGQKRANHSASSPAKNPSSQLVEISTAQPPRAQEPTDPRGQVPPSMDAGSLEHDDTERPVVVREPNLHKTSTSSSAISPKQGAPAKQSANTPSNSTLGVSPNPPTAVFPPPPQRSQYPKSEASGSAPAADDSDIFGARH